jgi:hypothetical protein
VFYGIQAGPFFSVADAENANEIENTKPDSRCDADPGGGGENECKLSAKLGALVSADAILDVRFVAVGLRIKRISVEDTTRDYIFASGDASEETRCGDPPHATEKMNGRGVNDITNLQLDEELRGEEVDRSSDKTNLERTVGFDSSTTGSDRD